MANRKLAYKFRNLIKPLGLHSIYVDARTNGRVSIGCYSVRQMGIVKSHLEGLGYECQANGKPGTSGEFIVDISVDMTT